MRRPRLAPLLVVLAAASCAREEPPPGTNPEQQPPLVRTLRPADGANVESLGSSASLRFNEPIANPQNLVRQLVASPAGDYDIEPRRSGFDIRPDDGWQPGAVYYFRLPAGVSDLLRNSTTEPIEWLFRIGGAVPATEVRGRLIDRVTGRGHRSGTLVFLAADSIPYSAVSDTGGVFRMPGLPAGSYTATGFVDQDRDYVFDVDFEPGASVTFDLAADESLAGIDVVMLPADSTPPVVASASALDPTRVAVTFDDPLDDAADQADVSIEVRGPGGVVVPAIDDWAYGTLEAARDSAAAAPDSVAADTLAAAPAAPAGMQPAPTILTVRFVGELALGSYEIDVAGVSNLRGLVGGGSAEFEVEAVPVVVPEPELDAEGDAELDEDAEPDPEGDPDPATSDEP